MQSIIPPVLLQARNLDAFLSWLRDTHLSPEDRKRLLMYWADRVGLELTQDMIHRGGID